MIRSALDDGPSRVVATAFRLGIDCSETSRLESVFGSHFAPPGADPADSVRRRYPWGIRAVQLMVNLRSRWLKMPYGDQALAMRRRDLSYIGGFPHQPIMEDYDLVRYLRSRADAASGGGESLRILPATCWCSPRRWQAHGVLYVTLANAVLVHRYTRDEKDPRRWGPEQVFEHYYRRPRSQRDDKDHDRAGRKFD
jgi:hypothetical protein